MSDSSQSRREFIHYIKPFDVFLLLAAAGFCIFLFFAAASTGGKKLLVEIKTEKQTWLYDLAVGQNISALGPLGNTDIIIENNSVHVHDSACKEKICVQTGTIEKAGQWIACLPNKVFITIKGKKDDSIDILSF